MGRGEAPDGAVVLDRSGTSWPAPVMRHASLPCPPHHVSPLPPSSPSASWIPAALSPSNLPSGLRHASGAPTRKNKPNAETRQMGTGPRKEGTQPGRKSTVQVRDTGASRQSASDRRAGAPALARHGPLHQLQRQFGRPRQRWGRSLRRHARDALAELRQLAQLRKLQDYAKLPRRPCTPNTEYKRG